MTCECELQYNSLQTAPWRLTRHQADPPDVEQGDQRGDADGQLHVPPVLDEVAADGQQDEADGPEHLGRHAGHGAVVRREQLHHHRVAGRLQALRRRT